MILRLTDENLRRMLLVLVVVTLAAMVLFSCDGPNPFPPSG